MFEKNMRLAYLLDFYAEILDEHSQSIMRSYYYDDLSLSEIAKGLGISRQGVRHIIKKCEEQLDFLETRLGLAAQFESIKRETKILSEIADELEKSCDFQPSLSSKIRECVKRISNGEGSNL